MKVIFLIMLLSFFCSQCNRKRNNTEVISNLKKQADSVWHAKDDPGAIILYSKLIKLDSTNGENFFHRGVSYSKLLNANAAIHDFFKAAELNYKVAAAYRNIAVNYSGIDDSLAVYYINKSLEISPNDSSVKRLKQKYEMLLREDKLAQ